MKLIKYFTFIFVAIILSYPATFAQDKEKSTNDVVEKKFEDLDHRIDQLAKAIDDIQWYNKVGDVANIEKVFIVGPPPAKIPNPIRNGR